LSERVIRFTNMLSGISVLDLYCGIGGLSLGFALALGARVTGLDIDKWAVETYNLNLNRFGCRAVVQDVLKWKPEGEFDIVIGGPPCQPFSVANTVKRGEDHPLFPTFPRFFDVVLELRPKVFLMENVKGLITKTFAHYLVQQLSRMQDYHVKYAVLNAVNYGVPQRRERLFVVGIRKDLGAGFEFPKPTHAQEEYVDLNGNRVRKWIILREAIGDIIYLPPAGKAEMTGKQKTGMIPFMDSAGKVIELPWSLYQKKHPLLDPDKPSYTLYSHMAKSSRDALLPVSEHVIVHEVVYKRITVKECLRIQSFPDWWRFPDGCSVSKRYKLVGEAVPPILAYRIAVAIGRTLGLEVRGVAKDEWPVPYFDRAF
jgi:DNA (cytosine-5)-methyltransferase 1